MQSPTWTNRELVGRQDLRIAGTGGRRSLGYFSFLELTMQILPYNGSSSAAAIAEALVSDK